MIKERRKAIKAELIRESKDNPGYFRYNITIKEKDGRIHDVPAYGVDMEDAIERLLWAERVDKITNTKGVMSSFAIFLLCIIALSGIFGTIQDDPLIVIAGISICIFVFIIISLFDSYLNKK